jgi:hypothetical protein
LRRPFEDNPASSFFSCSILDTLNFALTDAATTQLSHSRGACKSGT